MNFKLKICPLLAIVSVLLTVPIHFSIAKPYRGAELRTHASFTYGRFEVRMKSAAGSGLLSSFFTYHDNGIYPAEWNEIDIENLGRYSDQVQFNVISPGQVNHVQEQVVPFNPHAAFHDYSIEWTPDYVAWGVDGYEIYRQTGNHIQSLVYNQKLMMNIWPPAYPEWVGTLIASTLPVYAYYDRVRYYEYTPTDSQKFTLAWEDDFDNWDQSRWGKATHTWNGNNSDFIQDNAVFQDGYMILCLTMPTATGYSGAPVVDEDVDPPYVVWASSYSGRLLVYFSESVDPATAENPANYLAAGLTMNSAVLLPDQRTVRLSVDNLNLSTSYTLIVTNVRDRAQPPNSMGYGTVSVKTPVLLPAKINVGGGEWNDYLADHTWQYSREYGHVGGFSIINSPALSIQGTSEPEVYRTEQRGISYYQMRLPDGVFEVTLKFAETQYTAAGERVFDIYAERQLMQENVDIFSQVGANTAYPIVLSQISVSDGMLEIYFDSKNGEPVLNGLEIQVVSLGIAPESQFPSEFDLEIFPNPFNPSTNLRYQLPNPGIVEIRIYNVAGQLVTAAAREKKSAGLHQQTLNLSEYGSGIYFVEIRLDSRPVATRKITMLK